MVLLRTYCDITVKTVLNYIAQNILWVIIHVHTVHTIRVIVLIYTVNKLWVKVQIYTVPFNATYGIYGTNILKKQVKTLCTEWRARNII